MDDLWNVHRTTEPTARKRHICNACYGVIEPGESYRRTDGVWDGRGETFKHCTHCRADEDLEWFRPSAVGEVMHGFTDHYSDEIAVWYSEGGEQWQRRDDLDAVWFSKYGGGFEKEVVEAAKTATSLFPFFSHYPTTQQYCREARVSATRAAQLKAAKLTRGRDFVVVPVSNDDRGRGERSTLEVAVAASSVVPVVVVSVVDGRPVVRVNWRIFDQLGRRIDEERLEY